MNGNTFGKKFCVATFGESHGVGVGCVIDGCPAGIEISRDFIQSELDRRRPGQSKISTPRDEKDHIEILSGVSENGVSLGTPIAMMVRNKDAKSGDYDELKDVFRPGHADFTYEKKYGIRDHRGGGRSSARETLARVAAGAVAKLILAKKNIETLAWTDSIYDIQSGKIDIENLAKKDIESNIVRCPDQNSAKKMIKAIESVKKEGDSVGGTVRCVIKNLPVGLGEPVFDKFHAVLSQAMMSINAAKGFEIGAGFQVSKMKGSENNDEFFAEKSHAVPRSAVEISCKTNHAGGVLGGITSGENVDFRVAFKPTATIAKKQNTVSKEGENIELSAKGRHDPCIVPRAVPIVEAMAALVAVDFLLRK